MSEREASTPQKKECEHLIMYLFIYPRWRTFGGRQQCALSLSLGSTMQRAHPFKGKMSALATRTRSLYKYDVYYRRGKKERKEIWSNFFADEGCPLKSYTRNQFTGTTNTHISLCIGNTYYI
jgi:hypothetical protein